jgi:two-component system, sensor histidine kinase LadS
VHRLVFLALLLHLGPLALAAETLRLSGGYWVDIAGDATWEVALAHDAAGAFVPFSSMLTGGFVGQTVWVRLDVPAGGLGGEDWVLRIRPSWHDEVQLFDPAHPSPSPRRTGHLHPWSGDEYGSLNLNFLVPQGEAPRSLMLRIASPHSLILSAELLPLSVANTLDLRQFAWFLVYVVFLAFVLFGAVSVWLNDRDPLFAVVSLTMASGILYAASMFGLLRVLLDGVVPNTRLNDLNDVLIILYPLTTIWFYRAFLRGYGLRRWARFGLDVSLLCGLLSLVMVFVGATSTAFIFNNAVLLLGVVWLLVTFWFGLNVPNDARGGALGIGMVRFVAMGLLSITLVGLMRTLGFVGNQSTVLEGFLTHVFVVSLLLSLVLQFRARQRRLDLVRAEQRAMYEVRVRENLQRFMDMFSHEVRTPLAILSLAVEQGVNDRLLADQARGAIEDLDRLVTRSLQVDAMEAAAMRLQLQEVDFEDLIVASAERLGLSDALVWGERAAVRVKVDPYLAQVVISNLLENAAKYGARGVPITLAVARRSEGTAALTVHNRLDERGEFDATRVFDKYYRSPYAARRSGAGVGLYLSKALAELQGGGLRLAEYNRDAVAFELWVQA